jgi:hypothetical protein
MIKNAFNLPLLINNQYAIQDVNNTVLDNTTLTISISNLPTSTTPINQVANILCADSEDSLKNQVEDAWVHLTRLELTEIGAGVVLLASAWCVIRCLVEASHVKNNCCFNNLKSCFKDICIKDLFCVCRALVCCR